MRSPRARLRLPRWLFATVGLVLAGTGSNATAGQAEDRKTGADPAVQTDPYGDPLPQGAIARLATLRDNIGEMSGDIVLSPDGKTITATSGWFVIPLRLWDLETGRVSRHLTNLEDRAGHAKLQRVAYSPDGNLLATGDSAGVVRIGTMDTGRKIREFQWPEPVVDLAFLPDVKILAVAYGEGAIWLYRLSTGEKIRSLALAPYFNLYGNVFSPRGSVVSVRRLDNSLSLRDVPTSLEIRRLWKEPVPRNGRTWLGGQPLGFGVGDGVLRAFSPNGKLLAFVGQHDTLDVSPSRTATLNRAVRHLHRSAAIGRP